MDTYTIPFPLRTDLVLEIRNMPRDLTPIEAERLAAFIRTLVQPDDGGEA